MKRVIGLILVGLGFALLVCAPLFRFYVVPSVATTPLDDYTVSKGVGMVIKQLDLAKFAVGAADPYYPQNMPMTSTRYTRGDVLAAEQDPAKSDGLAVYDTFERVDSQDGRLVTADTSRYAFDRKTSELANCCGSNVAGNTVNFSGVMPLKFPVFTAQQSYDVWDAAIQAAVPANFQGEEDHAGLSTYKFVQTIPPTLMPGTEQQVPGASVGTATAPTVTVNRYYANTTTMWVEPLTGQIVDSAQTPLQTLRGTDGQTDLVTVAQIQATGEPAYVSDRATEIASKASQLKLFMTTLPIIFLIVGLLCAIIGYLLVRFAGKPAAVTQPLGYGPPPPSPNKPAASSAAKAVPASASQPSPASATKPAASSPTEASPGGGFEPPASSVTVPPAQTITAPSPPPRVE